MGDETNPPWQKGQRAVINRTNVIVIDRVTPSGRAIVGNRTFNTDGFERGSAYRWPTPKLEHLSPEIEKEISLVSRGKYVSSEIRKSLTKIEVLVRDKLGAFRNSVPEVSDVEKIERLMQAINHILEQSP